MAFECVRAHPREAYEQFREKVPFLCAMALRVYDAPEPWDLKLLIPNPQGSGCKTVRTLSLGRYSHSLELSPGAGDLCSVRATPFPPSTVSAETDSRGNLRYLKSARLTRRKQHGPMLWL